MSSKLVYPADVIKAEIEKRGLTLNRIALRMRITASQLSVILNQGGGLSPKMALRVEAALGISADDLVRWQAAVDLAKARKEMGAQIKKEVLAA